MSVPIGGVSHMMRRALNTLDYRLMDHGERVAFLVLSFFRSDGNCTPIQLKKICYLCMLHDVGAYKTELIDSLVDANTLFRFEVRNTFAHSIYSYLFLKECTFLDEYVHSVLFHHFPYDRLIKTDCENKLLASRMFLADRLDIMITKGRAKTAGDVFHYLDNPVFSKDDIARLKELELQSGLVTRLIENTYLDELFQFLETKNLEDDQIASLAEMLPNTIDFRSESTVTHTAATVEIALALAELFSMTPKQKQDIYYGALLHDIGKISVSLMILEKQSALTNSEFTVMRDHVLLSEYILKDHVSKKVLHIAVRHHEKLDGSGYPYGLKGNSLTRSERIVAVADILSALMGRRSYKEPFPEEKVREIITQMADQGKICSEVASTALAHYDLLAERVLKSGTLMMNRYLNMERSAGEILQKYEEFL